MSDDIPLVNTKRPRPSDYVRTGSCLGEPQVIYNSPYLKESYLEPFFSVNKIIWSVKICTFIKMSMLSKKRYSLLKSPFETICPKYCEINFIIEVLIMIIIFNLTSLGFYYFRRLSPSPYFLHIFAGCTYELLVKTK